MPPSTSRPGAKACALAGLALLSLTGLFVLSHARLFLLGQETFTHDTRNWFPVFACLSDGVAHGTIPLWSPFCNTGEPFFPLPTALRFYDPGTLATMWLGGKLGVPLLTQYHLDLLRRFVLFSLGAAAVASQFSRHRGTPFFAYAACLFSSIPVAAFRQSSVICDAYPVPWALFFLHRLVRGPARLPDVVALGFFLGMSAANYKAPEAAWFYAVYGALTLAVTPGLARRLVSVRALKALLLAAVTGGACTVHLWEVWTQRTLVTATHRKSFGIEVGESLEVPFGRGGNAASILDLAGLLCPSWGLIYYGSGGWDETHTNECTYYAGIWTAAFALLGTIRARTRVKWVWLGALLALGSVIGGARSPLAYLSHHLFPGFDILRQMALFQPFAMLAFLWLGCLGADLLLRLVSAGRRRALGALLAPASRAVLGYTAILLLLAVGYLALPSHPELTEQARWQWGATFLLHLVGCVAALGAGLLLLHLLAARRLPARAALALGAAVLLLDLMTAQRSVAIHTLCPRAPYEVRLDPGFPFWPRRLGMPREYAERDLEHVYAYLPLIRKRAYAWAGSERKLFVEMRDFHRLRTELGAPELREIRQAVFGISTPVLRFAERVRAEPRETFLATLKGPGGAAAAAAVTVHDAPGASTEVPEPGREDLVRVDAFGPDDLEASVRSPRRGFLYYADHHHPYWECLVDGAPAPIVRANYAYKGVFLEAGEHRVTFRFRAPLFTWGLRLMLAMHLLFLAGAALAATGRAPPWR